MFRRIVTPFALGFVAATATAQQVGTSLLDDIELEGFSQTKAEGYDDLFGRAVLIEFFAYW